MSSTSYYNENRDALFEQYHSHDPEIVHRAWAPRFLKDRKPGFACDIGAGSGRDANWLAAQGWEVVAVEPSRFREPGEQHAHLRVTWLDDALPELGKLHALGRRFDLILLCAVWMHVPQSARERAFRILTELLNPSGLLVINLRLGRDEEENRSRGFHPISADELLGYARDRAINLKFRDKLPDRRRGHIEWEWLIFEMPRSLRRRNSRKRKFAIAAPPAGRLRRILVDIQRNRAAGGADESGFAAVNSYGAGS